jgi:acyl-CoA dehydrogenase
MAIDFSLPDEVRMLNDLVHRFVEDELVPLEAAVMAREAAGKTSYLTDAERARVDSRAKELGLFGLDAPETVGGSDLPVTALVGVNEELGRTPVFYLLPPDTPNLTVLLSHGTNKQKAKYLPGLMSGEITTAIALSEPGAGSDPSGMKTRAERVSGGWEITGRKIWISNASKADFMIAFGVTGHGANGRPEVTAFLVDKGVPGLSVERRIPMLSGWTTYEVAFDKCRVDEDMVLGEVGKGWAPMQKRLDARRVQVAAWSVGAARRALEMMVSHSPQRITFGLPLSERQAVQFWITEAQTAIHASQLMCLNAAWKIDSGLEARTEVSMLKAFATEMAWTVIDRAMQLYGGMGVSKETPLYLLAENVRLARVYEGPTEVHLWRSARDILKGRYDIF